VLRHAVRSIPTMLRVDEIQIDAITDAARAADR
jgi:hypothetical protein